MLIGGDDLSNDVITLGTCFHVFFNVCLHSCLFKLCADWQKSESSVDGEPQGNWRLNLNSRYALASSPSFSRKAPLKNLLAGLYNSVLFSKFLLQQEEDKGRLYSQHEYLALKS